MINNEVTKIVNGKIIAENGVLEDHAVYFSGSTILAVTDKDMPYDKQIDAEGLYVSPGFIDTHVHGGGGSDFMDGGAEPIVAASEFHLKHGTTTILPTTLACSHETLMAFLQDLRSVMEGGMSKANIPGAHLEGPYFSHAQSGAQKPEYIRDPKPAEYGEVLEKYGDIILKWSFAPERKGSEEFCEALVKQNIVPSVGHSDATLADIQKVHDKGCKHYTHLYSGMSTITRHGGYRVLGAVESAYYFDDVDVEVIADGKHLPPELLQLIIKQKGSDNVCLITDGMRGAGMPEGESFLGRKGEEMPCIIEEGIAKLPDRTAFAGSVATTDRLVRTVVKLAGIDLCEAVKMMTKNPARIVGLKSKGILKENYDADIILFDEDIQVKTVIVDGKTVIQED